MQHKFSQRGLVLCSIVARNQHLGKASALAQALGSLQNTASSEDGMTQRTQQLNFPHLLDKPKPTQSHLSAEVPHIQRLAKAKDFGFGVWVS